MAQMVILDRKCDNCGKCAVSCPFSAISMRKNKPEMNAACKVCGICIKACPRGAIIRLEAKAEGVDKAGWEGILIFAEISGGKLHPVSLELIGKARQLAAGTRHRVMAVVIGENTGSCAEELRHYGVSEVAVYEDPGLSFFRADAFASCMEDYIRYCKPSVVLVGATALGRSLAPRLSTRFHTGLTADCTRLELRENSDLVQIRPAFGGNIMAQIVTPNTRPQFATVRYKVMDAPAYTLNPEGIITVRRIPGGVAASPVRFISAVPVPAAAGISDAEVLVVGGRGLQKEADLGMVKELAALLNGDWAVSRPLAEKGWAPNSRQIGLSGRTVRPKLIITLGVSGAIQFAACMSASQHIIAVNTARDAPIFQVAHIGIIGDLYNIVPEMIGLLKGARVNAVQAH
jgi:electron transfer flavoprotein alpha subunit